MIYDLASGFCFVHIPRTAGMSITRALRERFPDAAVHQQIQRHLFAWQARLLLGPDTWRHLFRFAVMRSPWEIIASDYRLTLDNVMDAKSASNPIWRIRLARMAADSSFDRFVEDEYLGKYSGILPGGFWRTWCLDYTGTGMGVAMYRYDRLDQAWQEIITRLDCPKLVLPKDNSSQPREVQWTPRLIQRVGDLCSIDIDWFGYEAPRCD